MKRLVVFAVFFAGCGPSASEVYKVESDVLAKLEAELRIAEGDAMDAEVLEHIMRRNEENPPADNEYGERMSQTKSEAMAELKAAQEASPAINERVKELKAKIEVQRVKVRDAEEAL